MEQIDWHQCANDAISKAFRVQNVKARLAYLDLAQFYYIQAKRWTSDGGSDSRKLFR